MVGTLATKVHKTMHYCDTDETMVRRLLPLTTRHVRSYSVEKVALFDKNDDGSPCKGKHIIGKRNWTSVLYDVLSGDLVFDIRVELERGAGVTTG